VVVRLKRHWSVGKHLIIETAEGKKRGEKVGKSGAKKWGLQWHGCMNVAFELHGCLE